MTNGTTGPAGSRRQPDQPGRRAKEARLSAVLVILYADGTFVALGSQGGMLSQLLERVSENTLASKKTRCGLLAA